MHEEEEVADFPDDVRMRRTGDCSRRQLMMNAIGVRSSMRSVLDAVAAIAHVGARAMLMTVRADTHGEAEEHGEPSMTRRTMLACKAPYVNEVPVQPERDAQLRRYRSISQGCRRRDISIGVRSHSSPGILAADARDVCDRWANTVAATDLGPEGRCAFEDRGEVAIEVCGGHGCQSSRDVGVRSGECAVVEMARDLLELGERIGQAA